MSTVVTPQVLADPLGVIVDLVADREPGLDRDQISEVVASVAGGRAKRRGLAHALLDRPELLTEGRSPAPRGVGDLLIALRRAGAMNISPPICAECGKLLQTLQRRGQHWYCGVCGPRREPCAGCGKTRPVHSRDRDGRACCTGCQSAENPIQLVIDVVAGVDDAVPATVVAAAARAAASQSGQRRQLAWALQDRPELLTGAGAEAPVPSVLRLIDLLIEAGARGVVRPPCPRCGRVIALVKPRGGVRLCRNCVAKSRAETCSRCGIHREPATRDEHGRPLCPHCLITDPANQETCVGCGRRRPVSVRTPGGPLCPSCTPTTTMTCAICGRTAPAVVSKLTGQPWCRACRQRRARCVGCGNIRPLRGGSLSAPLCATCTRPGTADWHTCPGCGERSQNRSRRCGRCSLLRQLGDLLADHTGRVRPQLQALHQHLAHHDRPDTVLAWLNKPTAPAILRELVAGARPLSHATLDEMPDSKPLRHLRAMLVATGALPTRDEQMARLERWITATIAQRDDTEERQLLHRYAVWHVLRRLRRRIREAGTTYGQVVAARRNINAAMTLLDWLACRGQTLTTARQDDLEAWLVSAEATARADAGNFIRWARRQKLTALEFPAVRWRGPTGVIDTETRWKRARQLLHDDSIKPEDRVAGLLVVLYAQTAAAISRLTLDHVKTGNEQVRLQLGREPIALPAPVDALVQQLIATRRGHAALGDQGTSPWLFPGGRPGQPISAERLTERLRQIGIQAGPSRSTALFQLATDLPAAVLARLLGIHISVAATWQRASAGDWTNYAAEISQRNNR